MPPVPKLSITPQDPPNAIQIELVEGCSLNCQFCGVQGIRETRGGYKYMTCETMDGLCVRLAHAIKNHRWNPRIELAMHGEPTMHPQIVDMVAALARVGLRSLSVVSNGTGFSKKPDLIDRLVRSGVDWICLDEYDGCDFVQKALAGYSGDVPIYRYDGSDEQVKFWSQGNRKPPGVIVKSDVSHLTKPYDRVNTHCGGGGKPHEVNPALHKRCAKPFRELAIRWDGNVALCCNDFRGIYKIGNLLDYETLDGLWHAPGFEAARRVLYAGSREFVPCQWCDALSPRVGLLPDKYGKKTMPAPDRTTTQAINAAIAGESLTVPVLRGWEIGGNTPCLPPLYDLGTLRVQKIDQKETPAE